ncbi:MAG TPA: tRNA lysidine(34) synthetase TilS [Candidatus Saccharimonadales bacterium]|nr:tRNA lysidine(34) synthetase TilS [Candidatus Saccharimonadales bacterium]
MQNSPPQINLSKGTYVAAVSGGVDSMVLLDLLASQPGLKIVVAHFDHGIRGNSNQDLKLVQKAAARYKLPFVFDRANLGEGASEAEARKYRYQFLNSVRKASGANAVITAHHQNDLVETAIFNLLRGTGRRGLSSLRSREYVVRPFLNFPKQTLIDYAKDHNLAWNEDSTNQDVQYKRNYIRHRLLPKIDKPSQDKFIDIINQTSETNRQLEIELNQYLRLNSDKAGLIRKSFILLPHKVAVEVLIHWLRQNKLRSFDRKLLDDITVALKTYSPGQKVDVNGQYFIMIGKEYLALNERER